MPAARRDRAAQRGITLIELTVALAIAAIMFSGAALGIGSLIGMKAKSATSELSALIRSMYDTAALTGKTCRLVFELPPARDEDASVKYWAECASGATTTGRDRDQELKDLADEERKEELGGRRDSAFASSDDGVRLKDVFARERDRVDNAAKYSDYVASEVDRKELDSSVRLSVWTRHQKQAVSAGRAFLYFFPQGFTEKAHIALRQGDNVWTIVVSPLTGKTSIVAEELEVPRS
jgi:general secretion pathway protein H